MGTVTDLYLKDYAVCTLAGVRHYVGRYTYPTTDNNGQITSLTWSEGGLVHCAFKGDSNVRVPLGWGNTNGPLPNNPYYYLRIISGEDLVAAAIDEPPIFYSYGSKLVCDYPSYSVYNVPGEGYSSYKAKYIHKYDSYSAGVWEAVPTFAYSDLFYPEYAVYFAGEYFCSDVYTSVIINDVYYFVGTYSGDVAPETLPYTDFTVNDIICGSCKLYGTLLDQVTPRIIDGLLDTTPRTNPIMYSTGNYLSKVCVSEYCKENNIRPILTHEGTALYAIIPTATAGVQETYKSTDGGGTWLAV